jgi:hypothetical protein
MVTQEKKSDSRSTELTPNQKISNALKQVSQALKFNELIDGGAIRKAQRHFVEVRQLSISELQNEFVEALCNLEAAAQKVEIYESALASIEVANVAEMSRSKGGRPKNPWAEVAYEQAKQHLKDKGRLPTAKLLSKIICQHALSMGHAESSAGEEAFSVSTARDYLGYFKKSLPIFKLLSAEQWFSLFEGDFSSTRYFGENLFPP